ncbi:C-Jun-amino-terminal kinase-interacting protein 2-like [Ischnura elegans]|uniref:C-Jun-amino-terminal kinase-interacting protein 2-like n=1 Tax=Ischnura elegans TaxID=197161 RepID=UPI001ED8AAA9|nr:C-Jun-amino-terminal kinase-interacting protein 2-like [Ischnura elegans]XP_046400018.1 C-Jun-amino-terminal kinase-interacting protein 2-like [Ischnura elegans]
MLRSRKKDANLKPNRKLDKRSSRGMLFENEELRMRTIEINAEVERGQCDLKKLRRENQRLRRDMWALREEYERLEAKVRDASEAAEHEVGSVGRSRRGLEDDDEEDDEEDDEGRGRGDGPPGHYEDEGDDEDEEEEEEEVEGADEGAGGLGAGGEEEEDNEENRQKLQWRRRRAAEEAASSSTPLAPVAEEDAGGGCPGPAGVEATPATDQRTDSVPAGDASPTQHRVVLLLPPPPETAEPGAAAGEGPIRMSELLPALGPTAVDSLAQVSLRPPNGALLTFSRSEAMEAVLGGGVRLRGRLCALAPAPRAHCRSASDPRAPVGRRPTVLQRSQSADPRPGRRINRASGGSGVDADESEAASGGGRGGLAEHSPPPPEAQKDLPWCGCWGNGCF